MKCPAFALWATARQARHRREKLGYGEQWWLQVPARRRVRCARWWYGGMGRPKFLSPSKCPIPNRRPGEVLIRVKAIGVNFADLLQRMGLYPGTPKPPFVPGLEIAGVVEKIVEGGRRGEGEALKPGDAVVALPHFNAYAEWVAVPASVVYRLPPGMPFEDGAAIPVNYLTAYHSMFTMGNLQPGDRILIHGAAGGVGIAAVQLARAKGLVDFRHGGPGEAGISAQDRRGPSD